MNLIKKNIILVVILSITLVIAAVMIFFVIRATGKMKESSTSVADLRKKINELNEKSPAPLQENLERILNDKKMISEKVQQIQPIFGTPYANAIKLFAQELGMSVDDLKKEWRKTFRSEMKKGGQRTLIFVKFFSKFDSEKLANANKAFADEINKHSIDQIDETNLSGTIMEALGLPRKMDEISCKTYIRNMQVRTVAYLKKKESENDPIFTFKDEKTAEKLSFEKYEEAMPRPDEVPFIFKHWRMIQDLCMRMKAAKITYLDSISRTNMLDGDKKGKYLIFKYKLNVKGPIDSIRYLLNSMMEAYKDDKVYIVKSISLERDDEASKILGSNEKDLTRITSPRRRGFRRPEEETGTESKDEEKLCVPIIGVSDMVTAEIKFDYIIYIGNEIKVKE